MCGRSLMRGIVMLLFGLPATLVGWVPESASGADGTWNVQADGAWSDGGNWLGGTVADGSGNTAYFNAVDVPGGGITATLDTGRAIGNLAFGDTNTGTSGNWLLSGPNTLTLADGTPTVTVEQLGIGATATIATAIAGSSGLTKAGAGTLALTGSNNYSGGTTITAGTLKGTINSIRGDVLVNAGATVEFADPPTNTIANKITGDGLFRVFFTGQTHVWITGLTDFTGTVQLSKAVASGGKWTASGIGTLDAALIVDNLCQIYVASPTAFNKGITVSGVGNTENRGAIRLTSTLGGDVTLVGNTTIGSENGTLTGDITSGVAGTQTLTFAGAVTGRSATASGSIKDGVGSIAVTQNLAGNTLKLTGANSYSGLTTITAGTVQVGAGGATGTLGSGNVINNGALVFNRSGELTVANDISGTGSLAKQGAGTVTLSGNNSYGGSTTVSQGTLVGTGTGTTGSIRGTVQVADGATVQFNATTTGVISNTITGDGVLRLHLGSGTHTIMNNVSGMTGLIRVSNPGTPVSNKWSIDQSVSANAAVLLDPGSTMFVSPGRVASFSKGITLSGTGNTENLGAIRLAGTVSGDITLAGNTTVGKHGGTITGNIASGAAGAQVLTFGNTGSAIASGAIGGGMGTLALTQNAGGTLTLTGNNSYSGPTTISAGTLQVGAGGATGTLGSGDVVNNGALVFNRSGELTAANRISGTGGVTKQGSGTLTLSGTSSYGGATHIQGGILRLAPPTANPVTDGLTWSLDASDGLSINNGTPTNGDPVTNWTAGTGPTIGQTTTDRYPTYQTEVQNGLSAIRFDGVDDRLFSSTSHADVNTIFIVNAPAVQTGSGGKGIVGGTGDGGTLSDKGIRRVNGTNVWQQTSPGSPDDFAYPSGSQMRVNGIVTRAFTADEFHLLTATRNAVAMKFNAVGGYFDGRAYKGDVGELLAFDRILTAAEIDAVEAYLNAKWFGVGHVLPAGTAVTIDDGARLEVLGVSQSIGSLAGASGSSVLLDDSVLVVGGNNASTVFAGAIGGTGGLTKTGTGVLSLSGTSDYTGATTINAGTLAVTGSLGQTVVAVNNGGMLGGSGTIGGAVTVNDGGRLSPGMSTGVLAMGSLTLESGSTTLMEINGIQRGAEYDGIDIGTGGDLAYGGTLSLVFGNSSPFVDGATFDLFNFTDSVPGTFLDEVTSTGYYAGAWAWDNVDTFSLEFGRQTLLFSHLTGDLTIVPEPSTLALTILALIALTLGRPWRRTGCRA